MPNEKGKTKCHVIHVGKQNSPCKKLKVHNSLMQFVNNDTYLGDVLDSQGSNMPNIQKKVSKGIGLINQIMNILDTVSLGYHYIKIALLLRESILLNGMLTSVEVLHNLRESEIQEFQYIDKLLLRKILQSKISTPWESFYLELGIIPIKFIIKAKRIKFLHYILSRSESK